MHRCWAKGTEKTDWQHCLMSVLRERGLARHRYQQWYASPYLYHYRIVSYRIVYFSRRNVVSCSPVKRMTFVVHGSNRGRTSSTWRWWWLEGHRGRRWLCTVLVPCSLVRLSRTRHRWRAIDAGRTVASTDSAAAAAAGHHSPPPPASLADWCGHVVERPCREAPSRWTDVQWWAVTQSTAAGGDSSYLALDRCRLGCPWCGTAVDGATSDWLSPTHAVYALHVTYTLAISRPVNDCY